MPLQPLDTGPRLFDPTGRAIRARRIGEEAEAPRPSAASTLGAAFRQDNEIASIVASRDAAMADRYRIDEGFNPFDEIRGTPYETRHADRFLDVFNRSAFDARKAQIDMEEQDDRLMEGAGFWGDIARMGASLASPTTFLPGGAIYRSVKGGYALGKSALSVGVAAGAATAAQEAVLQETQQLRSGAESAFAIGGSMVLGGLLGAGAGAYLGRAEARSLSRHLDNMARTDGPDEVAENEAAVARIFGDAQSAGAAAVRTDSLDDLSVAGRAAGAVTAMSAAAQLNPLVRLVESPSALVRSVAGGLMETPIYLKKNFTGGASEQAAETLMKEFSQGAAAQAIRETNAQYRTFRRGGGALTRDEFSQAVGKAMRREDQSTVPEVAAAARAWRAKVFEPLKERAIEAGLLPRDVDVTTAASYFSRTWNWRRIEAEEGRFKDVTRGWVRSVVKAEVDRLAKNRDIRKARVEQEIADLGLAGEDRARLLRDLPEELKRLEADPRFAAADAQLRPLREQEAAARQAKPREAEALRGQIRGIVESAGQDYADYVTKRNLLATRLRRIRTNVAGRKDQVEQLRNRLADAEHSNIERLHRLHRSLALLDQRVERESPEAWAADLAAARTQFAQVLERSNRAQERLARANERTTEELATVPGAAPRESAVPLDFYGILDVGRARIGADPERAMPARPILSMLKETGGIDPQSPLAAELRNMGVTTRSAPGLFRKGGRGAVDNLVLSEHPVFAAIAEEVSGYIPEEAVLAAIRDEMAGVPWRSGDQMQAIEEFRTRADNSDAYARELDSLGIDLATMSNDDVMHRLSAIQAERNYLADLDEVPPPASEAEYGAEAPEIVTAREAELAARVDRRTELFEAAEAKRLEEMNGLADRIGELEEIDPEEAVRALRLAVEERVGQAAGLVQRETERMIMLSRRLDAADPARVESRISALQEWLGEIDRRYSDRVDIKLDGDNDFEAYVEEIVSSVFNQLTGRGDTVAPRDLVPVARGPLKERTFNIPDHLVEDFLESDVELVGRRYARIMAAEVELARKFGTPDMRDTLKAIEADYAKARADVDASPDLSADQKRKRLAALNGREKADKRDLEAVRDMLRGTYLARENTTPFARTLAVANTLNYLRAMGGVVVSSFADIARPMMVHGLGRYMGDGIVPLVRNLKAVKLSVEEARIAGAVAERILNTRMATWAEITDPYSVSSPFERFLENTAAGFSKLNGMVYWNDAMKSLASVMTQNRIIKNVERFGAIDGRERAYLAFLGIDEDMARRIGRQFAAHGETDGGVRIARTESWDDPQAVRAYRAALNKDVDSIIVTKGVGDTPLFSHTPLGRMVLQFKSFALASHQRALIRGLQERPSGVIAGMITATTLGMLIYWLKAAEANRLDDISDNPGRWMAEGLDRSGMFAIAFEVNNTMEKALGVGAYSALQAAFPDKDQDGQASRYMMRSTAAGFTGPTGDFVDTLVKVAAGMKDGDLKESDVNAIRRLAPGGTLPVIRSILEYGVMPEAREAVAD